jgi:hypothetical protein
MLLFLGFFAWNVSNAQCTPDSEVPDSVFVSPLPYNADDRPDGGITDTACVESYYELLFTFNVPDVYESEFGPIPIEQVDIPVENGINNLPASLDYVCNPPNCEFLAETQGCILISGTPEMGEEGEYDLTLIATIRSVLDLTIDVPADLEPGSHYYLNVKEAGFENCAIVSAQEQFASNFSLRNQPNPFSNWTQVIVDAQIGGTYTFAVHDIFGKLLHQERVNLYEGENTIDYNGSELANGFYIYSISDGVERVARKMAVNRR